MLSGLLLIFIISTAVGFVSGLTHILYRSKCTKVSCFFGCWSCERDVVVEEELDELEMKHEHHQHHENNVNRLAGEIVKAEMLK